MPYSANHKAATRERILDAAAPLLRARGILAVSIDEIMAAAGLTRGGFYAHFESKDVLVAAVLGRESGLQALLKRARLGALPPEKTAAAVLDYYLDPANRGEIARDCPMSTMSADVRRSGGAASAALQRIFGELVDELTYLIGDRTAASALGATIIGATTLAGAMGDCAASAELLVATRARVAESLAKSAAPAVKRGSRPA